MKPGDRTPRPAVYDRQLDYETPSETAKSSQTNLLDSFGRQRLEGGVPSYDEPGFVDPFHLLQVSRRFLKCGYRGGQEIPSGPVQEPLLPPTWKEKERRDV